MFSFLKKQTVQALADVLEDGREKANLLMSKLGDYSGPEIMVDVAVRVQPGNETPFDATMKAGLLKCFLIKPGVKVLVQYDPGKKGKVVLIDEPPAILERNPQLKK